MVWLNMLSSRASNSCCLPVSRRHITMYERDDSQTCTSATKTPAGLGDPLPDLGDHSFPFALLQDPSSDAMDTTATPTKNPTSASGDVFIADPTPTPGIQRRKSSRCLYPSQYYMGLESPAGLQWLQSPAIAARPGRSIGTTKKKKGAHQSDVSWCMGLSD